MCTVGPLFSEVPEIVPWHMTLAAYFEVQQYLEGTPDNDEAPPFNPFRPAVPFGGQTTRSLTGLPPNPDCSPNERVKLATPPAFQVNHISKGNLVRTVYRIIALFGSYSPCIMEIRQCNAMPTMMYWVNNDITYQVFVVSLCVDSTDVTQRRGVR